MKYVPLHLDGGVHLQTRLRLFKNLKRKYVVEHLPPRTMVRGTNFIYWFPVYEKVPNSGDFGHALWSARTYSIWEIEIFIRYRLYLNFKSLWFDENWRKYIYLNIPQIPVKMTIWGKFPILARAGTRAHIQCLTNRNIYLMHSRFTF